jgi:hypothetical protein
MKLIGPWVRHGLLVSGLAHGSNPILDAMHPKQRAFFSSAAKAKALLAGRQAGKTYGVAMWLIECWARYPGKASAYITKTATSATRRIWPILLGLLRRFGLKAKIDHSDLTITFENGYSIWCTGCKDKNEADKIRGESSGFQRIAIDEPATFPDELLEYLCTEAADATLMQTMGDIVMCGTPGAVPDGFWHRVCTSMGWHVATFTPLDNPFLPDPKGYIEQYLKKYGYKLSTPKVRREIFAEWVIDTEALVYIQNLQDFVDFNGFLFLPTKRPPNFTTLGVDLGYDPDPCAFTVAHSWLELPEIYLTRSYTLPKLTPDLIAGEIKKLSRQYAVHRVLVDAGGGGKTTAMALKQSYGVNCEATPKGEKRPKIDTMRGAINSRRVKVHLTECQELVSEYKTIMWSEDRMNHHPLCSDHNADAAIQACMPHKQFSVDYVPEAPNPLLEMDADKRADFEKAAEEDWN